MMEFYCPHPSMVEESPGISSARFYRSSGKLVVSFEGVNLNLYTQILDVQPLFLDFDESSISTTAVFLPDLGPSIFSPGTRGEIDEVRFTPDGNRCVVSV